MDNFDGSVMIALLPTSTEWCQLECPHMTLVYAGEREDLSPNTYNELTKDAASLAMLSSPIMLKVMGVEVFGEEDKVNVLRLQPTPELLAMRRAVEKYNASEYPFRPHATIGPAMSYVENTPMVLRFDRIMVGWGDEYLTFWLKR